MAHLSNDPIMQDIIQAAKVGHFDRIREEGPSVLASTPVGVLYERVSMMSPERRRVYLASIGRIRGTRAMLSGGRRSKRSRLWLSRGGKSA